MKPQQFSFPASAPPPKAGLYQMNFNCKIYPTNLKTETLEVIDHKPFATDIPDLIMDDFSNLSSSDPEDIFSDVNSSLESLNHIDTFSFFTERQSLQAFTI